MKACQLYRQITAIFGAAIGADPCHIPRRPTAGRSHVVIDEQGVIAEAALEVKPEESVQRAVAALG